MEIAQIMLHVEALIFASEKPVTSLELTEMVNNALELTEEKITLDQIESAVEGVLEKYQSDFYPFEVCQCGGGWQFLTKKEYHKTITQLNGEKYLKKLSSASLETLSIIAYKQPVTKAEIESIRGVSSDYAVQKLLEKELIVITGRNEHLPGHPLVYGTSKNFMDYFGINSPDDLPKLKEVFDETMVNPTIISEEPLEEVLTSFEVKEEAVIAEDVAGLVVSEDGELRLENTDKDDAASDENSDDNEGSDA
jgi:segregation and condensation protein B